MLCRLIIKMKGRVFRVKTKKWRLVLFALVVGALFGSVSNGSVVNAASSRVNIQERIRDKAVYQGVLRCYNEGAVKKNISASEYVGIESILETNASSMEVPFYSGTSGSIFDINDEYNLSNDRLTCYELFKGNRSDGRAEPLLSYSGKKEPTSFEGRKEFLSNMGYSFGSAGHSNMSCFEVDYDYAVNGDGPQRRTSNAVCRDNSSGKLSVREARGNIGYFSISKDNKLCFVGGAGPIGCRAVDGELSRGVLQDTLMSICGGKLECKEGDPSGSGGFLTWTFPRDNESYRKIPIGGTGDSGTLSEAAGLKAINYLSDNGYDSDSIKMDRAETRTLYQKYLSSYYGVEVDCEADFGDGTVWWFDGTELKECYMVNQGNNKIHDPVNQVGSDGYFSNDYVIGNKDALVALLNGSDMREYDEDELAEMGAIAAEKGADRDDEVLSDCRNSGAGNTLGWILCPILEIMGDAAIGMYDDVVEPQLRVKSQLFSNEEQAGSVPYAGWQQFRDIANVAFVVLLLVVIFSQLTGVGIDNYGIKRILPKLVIAIVLINLSYLVCMLLVDVSNIVGNGIQNLFDGLGNGLTEKTALMIPDASPKDGGGGGIATTGGNIVAVGLLSGLAFMTGSIWLNPITLFSLLFSALGVVISLVFLFLLLSVRQAAIVVLVVVSPVVVVCNILPNTKSLFDRWVKLFKTLLMVYPIAGLLVGGGNYVSKLLLAVSPDSFPMAITAMVMGIAPIFFLPGVLKDAMAMLGKVGATLNGLGDRAKGLSNRAGGAILKSEPVKNIDREFQLSRARGTVKKLNKKGNLTGYQARKLAANASMLEKDEKEGKAAQVYALREKYKDKEFKELSEAATLALETGNSDDTYGLLGAMNYIYGAKKTAGFISGFYGRRGEHDGTLVNDLTGVNKKQLRQSIKGASEIVNANSGILAELKENNKDIADMVASAGMDEDKPRSLADYTSKMANMEEKKWLTQDPEAIRRASEVGALSPETAASVLNKAQNPNSSYGGALKGKTRAEMENILSDAHSGYSRDASGRWVPSTPQPAPGGNNANGAGTLNGGRAFDAGSGFNQGQANEWDRQQQSEDQWRG